nr:glycosyltransferase family 10 [Desulfobotulus pelophilus]
MSLPVKEKNLSTVCSSRRGRFTLHSKRVDFTRRLKACLPEMDVFGHGVKPMADKAEALDPYRYHITIENHIYRHHLTEKLPDAFLGHTLPFYYGCPNASDYFPKGSFVPINIHDFNKTLDIIKSTIANNEYEDRLPYILEARRRVLEDYNLFEVIEKVIRTNPDGPEIHPGTLSGCIMNRQVLRVKKPMAGIRSLWEKVEIKGRHWIGRMVPDR